MPPSQGLICPHCNRHIEAQQYHAGFSNLGFMYCDRDGALLTWDTYSVAYTAIVGKHPWMLDAEEKRRVEGAILPCPRGGRFLFRNPPRCPQCNGEIAALLTDDIHFLVYGERFDADADGLWVRGETKRSTPSA
jgi:hypothetical protein